MTVWQLSLFGLAWGLLASSSIVCLFQLRNSGAGIAIKVIVTLIILGVNSYLAFELRRAREPINISPASIRFSYAAETYRFSVINATSEDLYGVTFSLELTQHAPITDFVLGVPASSRKRIADGAAWAWTADIAGGGCEEEATGKSLFWIDIFKLTPKEYRVITLTNKKDQTVDVTTQLRFFQNEPIATFEKDGQGFRPFRFPVKCAPGAKVFSFDLVESN